MSLDQAEIHQIASLVAAQVVEQFKTLGWAQENGMPNGASPIPPRVEKVQSTARTR